MFKRCCRNLYKRLINCLFETNLDVRKVGVEFAIQQSKELLTAGVPVLHYYSMGKSDNIHAIASELF